MFGGPTSLSLAVSLSSAELKNSGHLRERELQGEEASLDLSILPQVRFLDSNLI